MALASNLFAFGAVARGFGRNLSYLIPPLSRPGPQMALAIAVIVGLATLNYRGIKPGALVGDFCSGAKLIPILLFVAAGLFFVDWSRLAIPPPEGEGSLAALKAGGCAALFACTGFEYIPVPAGETDNPRRNVPLALIGALTGSILLYALVQIVFIGTHPNPALADKPLAEAAGAFLGPWAGRFIALGSVISSFGYLTAVALVSPRYLSALGEAGELPPLFARVHPRYATPGVAIVVCAVCCAGLAAFADFDRLADLNNAAVFAQYVPTCPAVLVLGQEEGATAAASPSQKLRRLLVVILHRDIERRAEAALRQRVRPCGEEHADDLDVSRAGGLVQRSDALCLGRIDLSAVREQHLRYLTRRGEQRDLEGSVVELVPGPRIDFSARLDQHGGGRRVVGERSKVQRGPSIPGARSHQLLVLGDLREHLHRRAHRAGLEGGELRAGAQDGIEHAVFPPRQKTLPLARCHRRADGRGPFFIARRGERGIARQQLLHGGCGPPPARGTSHGRQPPATTRHPLVRL